MEKRFIVFCSCQKIACVFDDYKQAKFFARTHVAAHKGHCVFIDSAVIENTEKVASDPD